MEVTQTKTNKMLEALKVVMGLDECWDELDEYGKDCVNTVARLVAEGKLSVEYVLQIWFITLREVEATSPTIPVRLWWRRLLVLNSVFEV